MYRQTYGKVDKIYTLTEWLTRWFLADKRQTEMGFLAGKQVNWLYADRHRQTDRQADQTSYVENIGLTISSLFQVT